METKTFQHESKAIQLHTYEQNEPCFPFAIVEENLHTDNGSEITTYKIILGNQIVDEKEYSTLQQAEDVIMKKPYYLIIALLVETLKAKEAHEIEQLELLKTKQNENNE